jgi:hypothetical protein
MVWQAEMVHMTFTGFLTAGLARPWKGAKEGRTVHAWVVPLMASSMLPDPASVLTHAPNYMLDEISPTPRSFLTLWQDGRSLRTASLVSRYQFMARETGPSQRVAACSSAHQRHRVDRVCFVASFRCAHNFVSRKARAGRVRKIVSGSP